MVDRASSLINIVGTNSPQPTIAGVTSPELPKLEDVTNKKYDEVRQNVIRGYQSQIAAHASTAQAAAEIAKNRGMSNTASEIYGLTKTVIDGLNAYQGKVAETKQLEAQTWAKEYDAEQAQAAQQEKAQAAQLIQNQKQEAVITSAAIQDTLLHLQDRIFTLGRTEGINTTRADIERVLAEHSQGLDPDTMRSLRDAAYTPLNAAINAQAEYAFEQQKQTQQASESASRSELSIGLTSTLAGLQNGNKTPAEANQIIQTAFSQLQQNTQGLDPATRLRVIAPILETIAKDAQTGEGARGAIVQKMQAMQAYADWYQKAQDSGLTNDPTNFRTAAYWEAVRLGIPEAADKLPDVLTQAQTQQSWNETQQKLQEAGTQQANEELASQRPQYVNSRAAQLAWQWTNGDGGEAGYNAAKARGNRANIIEQTAVGLHDQWQTGLQQYHTLGISIADNIAQYQALLPKVDPSAIGNYETIYDPTAQEYIRVPVVDPQTGEKLKVPSATQDQLRALLSKVQQGQAQLQELVQQYGRNGFNLQNPTDPTLVQGMGARADATEQAAQAIPSLRSLSGLPPNVPHTDTRTPNFNRGLGQSAPLNPPVHPLLRDSRGHVMPFGAGQSMEITAAYGDGEGSNHGGRFHAGVDFSSGRMNETDVGALAVSGGTVLNVFDWNGYGGTVMVRTPSGQIEQFSHLRHFNVKIGDSVAPGTMLGIVGGGGNDPMNGHSTGRHLHFQVWRSGTEDFGDPSHDTVSPQSYLQGIHYTEPRRRGLGAPQNAPRDDRMPSPNAMPLFSGNWFMNYHPGDTPWINNPRTGLVAPAEQHFNPVSPTPFTAAPIDRSHYPQRNNPNANYGYQAIARDPAFARALAAAGDTLGIPAQFLVDVMAMESTSAFDPHIDNRQDDGGWGHGYLGLIQINGDWLREHNISYNDVQRMTRADYVRRIVVPYFKGMGTSHLHTAEDVLAGIFIGPGGLTMSPQERRNKGDGNIRFYEYAQSLGHHVGRRYRTSYDDFQSMAAPVHTESQVACATCSQMLNRFGQIVPHTADLA